MIYTNGLGYLTKKAVTPIHRKKNFKNLHQNQRADCNETCFVALGMRAHYNLFNYDLSLVLKCFASRSSLVRSAFV